MLHGGGPRQIHGGGVLQVVGCWVGPGLFDSGGLVKGACGGQKKTQTHTRRHPHCQTAPRSAPGAQVSSCSRPRPPPNTLVSHFAPPLPPRGNHALDFFRSGQDFIICPVRCRSPAPHSPAPDSLSLSILVVHFAAPCTQHPGSGRTRAPPLLHTAAGPSRPRFAAPPRATAKQPVLLPTHRAPTDHSSHSLSAGQDGGGHLGRHQGPGGRRAGVR